MILKIATSKPAKFLAFDSANNLPFCGGGAEITFIVRGFTNDKVLDEKPVRRIEANSELSAWGSRPFTILSQYS